MIRELGRGGGGGVEKVEVGWTELVSDGRALQGLGRLLRKECEPRIR